MNQNDQQFHSKSNFDDEISLIEIIHFFKESWRVIAGFVVLGLAGATLFLWAAPKQYEASAQIKMAQVANMNNHNNNINPLGINIEEPMSLIARMSFPTSYPKETIMHCGIADEPNPPEALVKKVKLSIPRGLPSVVELKIRDTSKATAQACVDAIYQLIKTSQAKLIAPFIAESQKKLITEEERLKKATNLITRADKSEVALSAAYLISRDEIRYRLDQISSLQSFISDNETRSTHLIAPIYLNEEPFFPQSRSVYLIGFLIGGLMGLLLAFFRKTW